MLSFIACLLLGTIPAGCNDKERNTRSEEVRFTFEKLDSIQIHYLGNPSVHDLDPITGTVLFMEHGEFQRDIMVADFEGNIKATRIENIKKINGLIVVAYSPGYNPSDMNEPFTNKSPEEARIFRERMREKYTSRIAILDSLGNRLNDFVPEGLIARSMLVRNHELWMSEEPDLEIERDYFRLFRVGLKLD